MPIGGGIVPATGSTQFTELTYVTRRAFIPKLVVQPRTQPRTQPRNNVS